MYGWYIAAATLCALGALASFAKGGASNLIGGVANCGITYLLVYAALHS